MRDTVDQSCIRAPLSRKEVRKQTSPTLAKQTAEVRTSRSNSRLLVQRSPASYCVLDDSPAVHVLHHFNICSAEADPWDLLDRRDRPTHQLPLEIQARKPTLISKGGERKIPPDCLQHPALATPNPPHDSWRAPAPQTGGGGCRLQDQPKTQVLLGGGGSPQTR